MRYALLIYASEKAWADASEEDIRRVHDAHMAFGRTLDEQSPGWGGAQLGPSGAATTVRRSGDEFLLTDGPYAETAEQLGGFYLVDAADLDKALELAKALPADLVEVRPVIQPGGGG